MTITLKNNQRWLITGVAGFIGSNMLQKLLEMDQDVVGLDNFATGKKENLDEVRALVSAEQWARFEFIEGDIRNLETCRRACKSTTIVLHQAALGSVPRSLTDPLTTHQVNVDGFLNMLIAARDAEVERFVYASSSSVYGDHQALPKVEDTIGEPLSPYALTKLINEKYAEVFARNYGFKPIGLRYFNVFGPRQDPNGPYAAVIPLWFSSLLQGREVFINGDGETSRDFCYIDNCVQANLLAATTENPAALGQVFNIACGERTTLSELYMHVRGSLQASNAQAAEAEPVFRDFRPGDVRHSLASIEKAQELIGYMPTCSVTQGLERATEWFLQNR